MGVIDTKKALVVGIIVLFIGISITPINASNIFNQLNNYELKNNNNIKKINDEIENNPTYFKHYEVNKNIRKKLNPEEKIFYENEITSESEFKKKNYQNPMNTRSIIYVPDDYPTIQNAIDNANHGDTIVVRDGTYIENIIVDKTLVILSENGYSSCTIKQADSNKNIITLMDDYITIKGFKIFGTIDKSAINIGGTNYSTITGNYFIDFLYGIKGSNTVLCNTVVGNQ